MGFDWFLFGFVSNGLMIISTILGGMFLVWAWVDVAVGGFRRETHCKVPIALYLFTISVLVYPAALWCVSVVKLSTNQKAALIALFVVLGFALLLATRVAVRQDSGPGTRLVAAGSKILAVLSAVGLVLMGVSVPGLLAA